MKERSSLRDGYGFPNINKELVHQRAGNNCEFDSCIRPNNGIVHHLEACFIAKLDDKPKEVISDVNLNALMLCMLHAYILDLNQQYQVACLLYEKRTP